METPSEDPRRTPAMIQSIRKWLTGWMVTIVIVPVVLVILTLVITNYWNRPQLSISIAKALVGSHRVVRDDGVHEYRAVLDLLTPCVAWLVEHSAANEGILPPPTQPTVPRIVYGVYLDNLGRSELSDIRLTFRSRVGEFSITASPQLSLTQTRDSDPEGQAIRTITIASMAPRSRGVVIGTLPVNDGHVTVEPSTAEQFKVNYALGDADRTPAITRHVRFSGSRQLSDMPLRTIPVNELFTRQRESFGLDAINLPMDPVEFSAAGGGASMRIILAPFMACPTFAPDGSYNVPVQQRGVANPGTLAAGTSRTP